MTITAIVSGKLAGNPEEKVAQSGRSYVRCRVATYDGEHHITALVTAFSDTVCRVLMALGDGAAISVSGPLKIGVWQPSEGEARPNLSMVADAVLTAHEHRRVDKAIGEARSAGRAGSTGEPPPSRDQQRADQANRETRAQWAPDDLDDGRPLDF